MRAFVPLKDICTIAPPKSKVETQRLRGKMVSFLPMEDLGIGIQHIIPQKTRAIEEVVGSYTFFAEGDILLAKVTPCFENGKLGIATNLANGIGFGSSEFIVIRPNIERVIPSYLYFRLQESGFRKEGRTIMTGACGLKRLPKSFVANTTTYLPPIPEQQRIVDILDREFAKIDALKANAEKSLQAAKDLFQATLKKDLEPKEGWFSEELSSICRVINGRAYSKEEFFDTGKYRVLRVGNFFTNDRWYFSNLELEEDKYCEKGDLLYAWSASFGPRIWIGEKVIYHYHIWKLVNKEDTIRKMFLYYWLMSPFFMSQTMNDLHGTTMVHITKGIMERTMVSFPNVSMQDDIIGEIEQASHLCQALQENYQKTLTLCDDLKQSLLRKAFNGEL